MRNKLDVVFEILINALAEHENNNPGHGINCACMDEYITNLRILLTLQNYPKDSKHQKRVEYVFTKAAEIR